jgi:hypothetical protein
MSNPSFARHFDQLFCFAIQKYDAPSLRVLWDVNSLPPFKTKCRTLPHRNSCIQ